MADGAIFDLTQETVMTAAARIPLQETSGATRATSATFALMGGLENNTTNDTAADHSDITGVVGTLHSVNISAVTTNNLVLTLPDTAAVGERIGVYVTVGDDAFELEIRTGATGSLLNGVDTSAGTDVWKMFMTGEFLVMRCKNAGGAGDTDWFVEIDGRLPSSGKLIGSGTDQTITDNTWTKAIVLDTVDYDNGDITSVSTNEIIFRRSGLYLCTIAIFCVSTRTGIWRVGMRDGGDIVNPIISAKEYTSDHQGGAVTSGGVNIDISTDDTYFLRALGDTDDNSTWDLQASNGTYFEAIELL